MPENPEYQWAAMTAVQVFVNGYEIKNKNMDVSGGTATYAIEYEIVLPADRLDFFLNRVQFKLDKAPQPLQGEVTMLVDLSDERLEAFRSSGKHVARVCGHLCGAEAKKMPDIRRVQVRYSDYDEGGFAWFEEPTCDQLSRLADYQTTGVIGYRGEATYMAAAMGLAVIELDTSENSGWLTKYRNLLYRRVVVSEAEKGSGIRSDATKLLVDGARRNCEDVLSELVRRKTLMERKVLA
jgi:hypothetical protein